MFRNRALWGLKNHLHFTHSFEALRDIPFLDEHSVQVPPEQCLQGAAPVGAGGHGVVGVEVGGEVGGLHHPVDEGQGGAGREGGRHRGGQQC